MPHLSVQFAADSCSLDSDLHTLLDCLINRKLIGLCAKTAAPTATAMFQRERSRELDRKHY